MVVGHIVKGAFVECTDSKQIVVDTTTDSSSAAVSKPCILDSPRSYLVVAAVVVAGNFAHIAERIGATVECKNYTGCNFGHMCPTLAGY